MPLLPAHFDWDAITQGDTFPAMVFAATGTTTDLARVRVRVKDVDGNQELTLDSDTSGVTIDTATAGSWQYTIGPVSAALTGAMDAGVHSVEIETTDAGGNVATHFRGCWEIVEQIAN